MKIKNVTAVMAADRFRAVCQRQGKLTKNAFGGEIIRQLEVIKG